MFYASVTYKNIHKQCSICKKKKEREDMGEKSKREMSKLVLTDSLKFKYNYFLGLLYGFLYSYIT